MELNMKDVNYEKPKIEEGVYPATFKEAKEISEGEHGERFALIFTVHVDNENTADLSRVVYRTLTWNGKLGETLLALGGKREDATIKMEDFIGKRCKVFVENYEDKEGNVASTIRKCKPLEDVSSEVVK